jgi:hypothetical protein
MSGDKGRVLVIKEGRSTKRSIKSEEKQASQAKACRQEFKCNKELTQGPTMSVLLNNLTVEAVKQNQKNNADVEA